VRSHRVFLWLNALLFLLEMIMAANVNGQIFRLEADVMPAVIAWRKWLPVHARDIVNVLVLDVVDHCIDPRGLALLARLENFTD
jgi:hypothetical protein